MVIDQHTVDPELFQAVFDALHAAGTRVSIKKILVFVSSCCGSNQLNLDVATDETSTNIMRSYEFEETSDDSEVYFKAFTKGYLRNDLSASLAEKFKGIGGPVVNMMLGKAVNTRVVWVGKRFEGWIHTKDDLEAAFGMVRIPSVFPPSGPNSTGGAANPPVPPNPAGPAPAAPAAAPAPNLAGLLGAVMSNPAVQSGLMSALNSSQQPPRSN